MWENCRPGDMRGVQDGFNINADGVQVLTIEDGGNDFIGKFLNDASEQ